MERVRPTIMGQTGRKVEEIKHYVQRDFTSARKKQKLTMAHSLDVTLFSDCNECGWIYDELVGSCIDCSKWD